MKNRATDRIHGREEDGCRSVRPGAAELVEEAFIGQFVPSVERQRRAGDVTAEVLQALAVVSGNAHVSVHAVAIQAGAAGRGPGRSRRRVGAHTADEVAPPRAQGHAALYGSAIAGGQQRGLFSPGIRNRWAGWEHWVGPFAGAAFFLLLREGLSRFLTEYYLIPLGIVFIIMIIFLPQGLLGFLRRRLNA